MSNVVRLGESTPSGMVNDDLVAMLEDLLSRAKAGDFVGLAYAATDGDDGAVNGWESGGPNLLMSSASAILNARYQSVFIGE